MAFCIQVNVAGVAHRLRDWDHKSMLQGRFAKPHYLNGRFDWVDPLGRGYTRFPSFNEAEAVAEVLSVEQPHCVYTIHAIGGGHYYPAAVIDHSLSPRHAT